MAEKFKAGDQVKLKSGGPVMTVVSYEENKQASNKQYKCTWFDDEKRVYQMRLFLEDTLEPL